MSLLLDTNSISYDEDFKYACDDPDARLFVENLWTRYKTYADKDFTQKIAVRFHNHYWEMYLACILQDNGSNLIPKTKRKGPDIEIKGADVSRVWVEAVIATPGSGDDRVSVPKLDSEIWFGVPEKQIVLRYATAIDSKYQKYIQYRNDNVIEKSEPYVIALNGNKVPYSWDDEIPYVVQAVFPFGLPTLQVDWDDPEKSMTGYEHRTEIKKNSGCDVPTNIFLMEKYEGISAIIFSRIGIHEYRYPMGMDFILVHNPLAINRLPDGWLTIGREYRLEGNSLQYRRWPQ